MSRIPSFFCGLFGHKPSSNIVSIEGSYPYCGHPEREKFLVLGPICRYAVDLKLILKQIVLDQPLQDMLKLDHPVDLRKSKFYFLLSDNDPMKTKVSQDVINAINQSREYLKNHGCATFDADLPLMRDSFYMWLTALADFDSPKLACEVMERKGELNGWKELVKSLVNQSHFRKITCMNVILENMVYSEQTREWKIFRKAVDRCYSFKKQLESLLGNTIACFYILFFL